MRLTRLDHCLIAGMLLAILLGTAQQSARADDCDLYCHQVRFYYHDLGKTGIHCYYFHLSDCRVCGSLLGGRCLTTKAETGQSDCFSDGKTPQKLGLGLDCDNKCDLPKGKYSEAIGSQPKPNPKTKKPVGEKNAGTRYTCGVLVKIPNNTTTTSD